MFVTQEANEAGCYVMKLCVNGEFKNIVVDDKIPCRADNDTVVFSRAAGDELWVILLEKAWAKINGTFERISGGHTSEGLRCITGGIIEFLHHDYSEKDILFNKIKKADKLKYIICASAG